jgi:hypothetical protein
VLRALAEVEALDFDQVEAVYGFDLVMGGIKLVGDDVGRP